MNVSELRERMAALPEIDGPDNLWNGKRRELRARVLNPDDDPSEFLDWSLIRATMWVDAPYVEIERDALQYRLLSVARDSNDTHMAYHVAQWERRTGKRIDQVGSIFEFGPGYGALCRIVHDLGFAGRYVRCDSPEFLLLQEYYLSRYGTRTESITVPDLQEDHVGLLISTWALGETDLGTRETVLGNVTADSYLFTYDDMLMDLSNEKWFRLFGGQRWDLIWHEWPIPHLPHAQYLIGYRPC